MAAPAGRGEAAPRRVDLHLRGGPRLDSLASGPQSKPVPGHGPGSLARAFVPAPVAQLEEVLSGAYSGARQEKAEGRRCRLDHLSTDRTAVDPDLHPLRGTALERERPAAQPQLEVAHFDEVEGEPRKRSGSPAEGRRAGALERTPTLVQRGARSRRAEIDDGGLHRRTQRGRELRQRHALVGAGAGAWQPPPSAAMSAAASCGS